MSYCAPRGIPLSGFLDWSDTDQDAALAWQLRESSRCGGCGTPSGDWHEDDHAYHAHNALCPGCAAVARAQGDDDTNIPGVNTSLGHGSGHDCRLCNQIT